MVAVFILVYWLWDVGNGQLCFGPWVAMLGKWGKSELRYQRDLTVALRR